MLISGAPTTVSVFDKYQILSVSHFIQSQIIMTDIKIQNLFWFRCYEIAILNLPSSFRKWNGNYQMDDYRTLNLAKLDNSHSYTPFMVTEFWPSLYFQCSIFKHLLTKETQKKVVSIPHF